MLPAQGWLLMTRVLVSHGIVGFDKPEDGAAGISDAAVPVATTASVATKRRRMLLIACPSHCPTAAEADTLSENPRTVQIVANLRSDPASGRD